MRSQRTTSMHPYLSSNKYNVWISDHNEIPKRHKVTKKATKYIAIKSQAFVVFDVSAGKDTIPFIYGSNQRGYWL